MRIRWGAAQWEGSCETLGSIPVPKRTEMTIVLLVLRIVTRGCGGRKAGSAVSAPLISPDSERLGLEKPRLEDPRLAKGPWERRAAPRGPAGWVRLA